MPECLLCYSDLVMSQPTSVFSTNPDDALAAQARNPVPSGPLSFDLWDLDPAHALHCWHCQSQRVRNAEVGQNWAAYGEQYTLVQCDDCGGQFTHPSPSPEVLKQLYSEGFAYKWYRHHYPAKLLDSLHRVLQYARMGALKKGPLLDYGGGAGYFSLAARLCGYAAETRDPVYEQSSQATADAQSRKPYLEPYGVIACHHVLEHAIDPAALLRDMWQRLLPDGVLILAVPNGASRGYQQQGTAWVWAQPPLIHLHHITPSGLRALLARSGFQLETECYYDRWDASLIADVHLVRLFQRLDGLWSRGLFQLGCAQAVSVARLLALIASHVVPVREPAERSELLVVARRTADSMHPGE